MAAPSHPAAHPRHPPRGGLDVRPVDTPLRDPGRSSTPQAATMAGGGQPWRSKVRTSVTTAAAVRPRAQGVSVVAATV